MNDDVTKALKGLEVRTWRMSQEFLALKARVVELERTQTHSPAHDDPAAARDRERERAADELRKEAKHQMDLTIFGRVKKIAEAARR